ncbi:MAG TPA: recombinase family protein [Paracoccus solventivorans]|uniref:recombinase family protein n=1 Tax=Paracoccus solventivorans TaxID=53463 RepID=UPI002C0F0372|nr:recombinase family protein [Paracoccus solventivorans]HMM07889.1 recombinase family protein [Paracoccus solventivorans]
MKVGYARVSTEDQKLDLQIQALQRAGCTELFTDRGISGSCMQRPGLKRALKTLEPGGALVVWRLDRLGRSLIGLVNLMDSLGKRGVDFVSLTETLDTSCSGGRLVFHMMAALAEFERTLISERTRAGMAAARENGQRLGRPPALSHHELLVAHEAITRRGEDLHEVASRYNVTPRTLKKWLRRKGFCL